MAEAEQDQIGLDDYRVKLEAFEGPLDLLLFLIRRAEVDVHDIPIAPIAEQYLTYLGEVESIDVDLAGEFLVMAATLMEIKSRMIDHETAVARGEVDASSRPDLGKADETDPRRELVAQLLEYKKYRDAADALESRRETWNQRVAGKPIGVTGDEFREALEAQQGEVELEDLDLMDLASAFARIASSVNFDKLGEHEVVSDDTPIEIHAEDIVQRLKEVTAGGQLPLFTVLEGRTRGEMVGLFLALLTLIREERVGFRQEQSEDGVRAGIVLELRESATATPGDDAAEQQD
ncbi:MAG: segregation/condensation protein A [Planctomycetota bacterium]